MAVTKRRYRLLADFHRVSRFLDEVYSLDGLNSYLLQPFFEYAHTHPMFQHQLTHRFGLWEEADNLVAVACYEMGLGEAFLSLRDGYSGLLPAMLDHAEQELASVEDGQRALGVWIMAAEEKKRSLLQQRGYQLASSEPVTTFPYHRAFPSSPLPDGFQILSLEDENDIAQIHACLWKGFDHGPTPDNDLDCRLLMQSGPNFRSDLATVVKAPNGDYACFAGMWLNEANHYAYLEPMATVPEYRRMGLATAALVAAMEKTKRLGAEYCFGGSPRFYTAIGFDVIGQRELWQQR